ncbi:MAG: hypothetical protein EBS23_00750 [Betaproteobacteria bacterium]|nr:hypothetical protein [Betaproteobacteria bacterium]
MRLLTYLELSRYSEAQLRLVIRDMRNVLPLLTPGSSAHETALMNLRHAMLLLDRLQRRPAFRI